MIHWLLLCSHSILSHANAIRFQDSLLWLLRFVWFYQYYVLPLLLFSFFSLWGWVGVWWWCLFMAYSIWYHFILFNGHGYHNLLFIWSVNGHQVKWYGANNYPLLQFFLNFFALSIIVANLSLFLTGHSWSSPQCSCLTLGRKYNFV